MIIYPNYFSTKILFFFIYFTFTTGCRIILFLQCRQKMCFNYYNPDNNQILCGIHLFQRSSQLKLVELLTQLSFPFDVIVIYPRFFTSYISFEFVWVNDVSEHSFNKYSEILFLLHIQHFHVKFCFNSFMIKTIVKIASHDPCSNGDSFFTEHNLLNFFTISSPMELLAECSKPQFITVESRYYQNCRSSETNVPLQQPPVIYYSLEESE